MCKTQDGCGRAPADHHLPSPCCFVLHLQDRLARFWLSSIFRLFSCQIGKTFNVKNMHRRVHTQHHLCPCPKSSGTGWSPYVWCVYTRAPTMWGDDLCSLGRGSYIPCGQGAIRVTANKLFSLMVPSNRVDRLEDAQQHVRNTHHIGCVQFLALWVSIQDRNNEHILKCVHLDYVVFALTTIPGYTFGLLTLKHSIVRE